MQLLLGLLLNDDSLINDGFVVRDTLGKDERLMEYLFNSIAEANLKV